MLNLPEYSPAYRILPRWPGDLYGVREIFDSTLWAAWFAVSSLGWYSTRHQLIGVYETQKQAALAYNIYAIAANGKFALLNKGITMTKEETKAWLNTLTLAQLMALAAQNKIKGFRVLPRKKLTNRLLQIKGVGQAQKA